MIASEDSIDLPRKLIVLIVLPRISCTQLGERRRVLSIENWAFHSHDSLGRGGDCGDFT